VIGEPSTERLPDTLTSLYLAATGVVTTGVVTTGVVTTGVVTTGVVTTGVVTTGVVTTTGYQPLCFRSPVMCAV
jgi:hypothetical protein